MTTSSLLSEQKSILWSIPNFSKLPKIRRKLEKQNIKFQMNVNVTPEAVYNLEWTCYLYVSDKKVIRNEGPIEMYIVLNSLPPEMSQCHAKVQFQITDKEKGNNYIDSSFNVSLPEITEPQYAGLIESDTVPRFCPKNSPFLNDDGGLEIRVTVTVYHPAVQNAELVAVQADHQHFFARNLRNDLTDLGRKSLNISSVTTIIVSKDGVQFPVDRVILAARSLVFQGMFQSSMSEAQGGIVELKDMDSKPLEVLLYFIQTAELRQNWKNEGIVEGLVYGAHKYMIKDLLEFLDQNVDLVCTKTNCGKLMGLAKTLALEQAQVKLMQYFKKNMADDIDEVLRFAEETVTAARLLVPSDTEDLEEQPQRKKKRQV